MIRSQLLFALFFPFLLSAQGLDLLGQPEELAPTPTTASFKTNRIINGHSIEMVKQREFDFKISHRFGFVNRGFYDLFGLDNATVRIGGDFGITDRVNVGIGRSTVEKTYDGFLKLKLLQQMNDKGFMPISVVAVSTIGVNSLRWTQPMRANRFSDRLHYTHQLLIARKFSEGFSAQLSPTLVHRNLVDSSHIANDVLAIGAGIRQKLSSRVSVNIEYFHVLTQAIKEGNTNALSLGFDIETGGHVFQLFFTNASAPYEKGFITDTRGRWSAGDVRFGFNVARMFSF